MARKVNKAGLDLVKEFEGFYPKAYKCPAGVWTIGYGHTKGVKKGQTVTLDEAEQMLEDDLKQAGTSVEKLITVKLNPNQYAALTSFTFNVGSGNLSTSTLRKKLNKGDFDSVPSEMARWDKATVNGKKKVLPGLVRRRAAEGMLFLGAGLDDGTATAMPQHVENS